jgi:DNA modification methylase
MEDFENKYLVGDNLDLLRELPDESIDCIYTDPIYCTGRNFHDYDDRFKDISEYIDFMDVRIKECHRVLKNSGNIIVHVEPRISHILRNILDKHFGLKRFVNEIVWKTGGNAKNKYQLGRQHDTIIVYSKTGKHTFNPIYKPYGEKYTAANRPKMCPHHNKYFITTAAHTSQPKVNPRPNLKYEWNGHNKQWHISKEKMQELHDDNRLQYNEKGIPRIKRFLEEMDGIPVNDWFDDISNTQSKEKLDYATQKPLELINRLLILFSNKGDIVLDIFAGSGTLGRSCIEIGRTYIMFDKNENGKEVFEESIEIK